jgi:hypothetical protein
MVLIGSRVKHVWSGCGESCGFFAARRGGPRGRPGSGRGRPQEPPLRGFGKIKRGRKNPTQHRYHITNPFSSQRPNGPPGAKSVFSTKANVCIWETFRLEKLEIPCYLIVTKRNRKNTESSGGLPKANGKYGNQSDFKSK